MNKMLIPVIFQNAIFGLLIFTLAALKKTRNRGCYYLLFSKQPARKSSRPKPSILKDHGYILIFFLMLFLTKSIFAQSEVLSENTWRCSAYDAENKLWAVEANYKIKALNKSYAACKRESLNPKSCKFDDKSCEMIVAPLPNPTLWYCTALDAGANSWTSPFYYKQDDAALGAKAFCQQRSSLPESCYINMITCKNYTP